MSLTSRWPVGDPQRLEGTLHPSRRRERYAMADLLVSVPWDVYCTWTFRDRIGPERAVKQICSWIHTVGFAFGGNLGWMIGLEHDLGAEWCHGHGLLVAPELAGPVTLYKGKAHEKTVPFIEPFWLSWYKRHGGGKFVPIRAREGCAFYCAKYSAKRGDVIFSTGLERFRGASPAAAISVFPEAGGRQRNLLTLHDTCSTVVAGGSAHANGTTEGTDVAGADDGGGPRRACAAS